MSRKSSISLTYLVDCIVIILEISCFLTFLPSFTVYKMVKNILLGVFIVCCVTHILRFGLNFKILRLSQYLVNYTFNRLKINELH